MIGGRGARFVEAETIVSQEELADLVFRFSTEFTTLAVQRHVTGSVEYGDTAFIKNDMVRFIAEELADLSNYARYIYIKIRLWEKLLNEAGIDLSNPLAGLRIQDGVPFGSSPSDE